MGNLGWSEIMLIMIFALVVFGPQRLPEIARQVGKAIREVRRVSGALEQEVRSGLALDDDPNFPYMKGPIANSSRSPASLAAEARANEDKAAEAQPNEDRASEQAEQPPAPTDPPHLNPPV